MAKKIKKLFVMPIDGSANALKAVDYLGHFFGPGKNIEIQLLYVVPALPPILVEESQHNRETAAMLKKMQQKNMTLAENALTKGRKRLQELGIPDDQIKTAIHGNVEGVAQDICSWAAKQGTDAIVMSSRGQSRLQSFFMGATAGKVIDASNICPVWIVLGNAANPGVLIAVDQSAEALRAVDHAAFMLAGTDHPVTLFYSQRNLTTFFPRQVADAAPELDRIWKDRVGKDIAPVMEKARKLLTDAGVAKSRITVRVNEASRNAASDIIKTAQQLKCGTIVVGRRSSDSTSTFRMGSVSRNIVEGSKNTAVWIVP